MEGNQEPSEGPTFRPSAEEWRDPMAYIAFVRRHAEAAGIAKIIPPNFEPDFAFDKKRKVPTKLLSVHQLQTKDTSAAVKHFWEDYNAFLEASGSNRPKKKPTFIGQEIDLYALYRVTMKRGGYHSVTEDKTWKEIVAALQVSVKMTPSCRGSSCS
jgi:histone demethylase JARID1